MRNIISRPISLLLTIAFATDRSPIMPRHVLTYALLLAALSTACNLAPTAEPYTVTPIPTNPPLSTATETPTETPVPTATPTSKYSAIDYSPTGTPIPWKRNLHATTWEDLVAFLEEDHTNWHPYDTDSYVCIQFANDLADNALASNIKAGLVVVNLWGDNDDHAFVWFDTDDKGRVWIEPQTDTAYVQPDYKTKKSFRKGTRYFYSSDTPLINAAGGWAWPDMLLSAEVADSKYFLNCPPGGDICTGWKARVGELPTTTSEPGTRE